jgi:hypothetical protein
MLPADPPPTRTTFLFVMAAGMTAWFVIGQIAGNGPGGEVLGFAAAIWAAWDNEVIQDRRRREVRKRRRASKQHGEEHDESPKDDNASSEEFDDEDGDA